MSQLPLETVKKRYKDAYIVAKVLVGFGTGIKIFGLIAAGILFTAGGAFMAGKSMGAAIATGMLGALGGALIFIFGVLIAAQGQIQYALLDIAVNTSPILPQEDKAGLLSGLPTESKATAQTNNIGN